MPDTAFTPSQAADLARYFLGPGWHAAPGASGECFLYPPDGRMPYDAPTWRAAFRAAGVKLPFRRLYVNIGATVMDGETPLASARSATQAQRIARALNFYAAYHPDAA